MKSILITGGAGFIGSHLVKLMVEKYEYYHIINLDLLTYAGNLENLASIEKRANYTFVKGDICNFELVEQLFNRYDIEGVIHLAAESHVDRSIKEPFAFAHTNIIGALSLLMAAKNYWSSKGEVESRRNLFYHISTDEVYGSLEFDGKFFTEDTPYDPHSPYSASKASSDHFVRAFHDTYGMPIVITNCSNNDGPYQFPEKLIPLFLNNIRNNKPLPVFGKGENVRDWLFVEDHAVAIDLVFHEGKNHETYNIGGHNERKNLDVVETVCSLLEELAPQKPQGIAQYRDLIAFVDDRPGHDLRYAIDASKIARELGWMPQETFESGMRKTVQWYLANQAWWKPVQDGSYQGERLGLKG